MVEHATTSGSWLLLFRNLLSTRYRHHQGLDARAHRQKSAPLLAQMGGKDGVSTENN